MSAICGLLFLQGGPAGPIFADLMAALGDYGPDGAYAWCEGSLALGYQRLCSTSDSTAEKPLTWNVESQWAITADVRLDNRDELCDLLGIATGFRSATADDQLILLAYEKWGDDCAGHLLGDYAFAIWDRPRQRLFCARDHIGTRPFYYYGDDRVFVFATDIRAVLACPETHCPLDEAYIAAFLRQQTFSHPSRTFYAGVHKLPPAHTLIVSPTRLHTPRQYWFPEQVPLVRLKSDTEHTECFAHLVRQAVCDRLRTDLPVGSHISGGLDCTSVAVLAARELRKTGRDLHGFSWSCPKPENEPLTGERALIEEVGRAEGIPIHYTRDLQDGDPLWKRDASYEPTHDLACEKTTAKVAARQGIRLMLSGWGGDEAASFNGRGYYAEQLLMGRWLRLAREIRQRARLQERSSWGIFKAKVALPLVPRWLYRSRLDERRELPSCLNAEFADRIGRVEPLVENWPRWKSVRQTITALISSGHIAQRMEHWAANGAKHGLTYAYPLTDRRVLEFCLSIPASQFVRNGRTRCLLRNAMDGVLPSSVRQATKQDQAISFDKQGYFSQTAQQLVAWLADKEAASDWGQCLDIGKVRSFLEHYDWTKDGPKPLKPILTAVMVEVIYHNQGWPPATVSTGNFSDRKAA